MRVNAINNAATMQTKHVGSSAKKMVTNISANISDKVALSSKASKKGKLAAAFLGCMLAAIPLSAQAKAKETAPQEDVKVEKEMEQNENTRSEANAWLSSIISAMLGLGVGMFLGQKVEQAQQELDKLNKLKKEVGWPID